MHFDPLINTDTLKYRASIDSVPPDDLSEILNKRVKQYLSFSWNKFDSATDEGARYTFPEIKKI